MHLIIGDQNAANLRVFSMENFHNKNQWGPLNGVRVTGCANELEIYNQLL